MAQATLTARVDARDKVDFDAFCSNVGLNTSTAINLFVKAVLRENRIPFELSLQSNELTKKTIALAEEEKELNGSYSTMEDLRTSLDA